MISTFFHAVFYAPLYNGLIFLMDLLPSFDAGIVVILFTIIVKFILFPLSIKATRAQIEMKSIEKDLNDIKEKYKDNKELQAQKTIELYKERDINPFAGFFVLLIQLPIIISLYRIFLKSGLPQVNTAILYSFVTAPALVNMSFLGLINISEKNIILALLAGVSTYIQLAYATAPKSKDEQKTNTPDFATTLQSQMKYTFPIIVTFISWSVSGAVSLYWITSNIFTTLQELYMRKHIHKI